MIGVYSKDTGYGDSAPKGPNRSAQGNALGLLRVAFGSPP